MINFTEKNLSKIHINQLMQFLQNHDLAYKLHKNRRWIMAWNSNTKYLTSAVFSFCNEYFLSSYNRDHAISVDAGAFHELVMHLYPDYVQGNLTQFHELFTQVYNEIMSYSINEKE